MNKRHGCIVVALACVFSAWVVSKAPASEIGQEVAGAVDVASYQHYLDDVLYTHEGDNRGPNGPEHDLARDAIAAEFEALGLEVEFEPVRYEGRTHYNVVATKRGRFLQNSYYLIGAHYDSVGNPGADDDASGVAGLLELARVFANYDTGYNLVFIAFDLEEQGLVGSEQSAINRHADAILGMIQLDMIAWGSQYVVIEEAGVFSESLGSDLSAAIAEYGDGLAVASYSSGWGGSDHYHFGEAGFPSCLIIENSYYYNPCYHQYCDNVDRLNYINYTLAANVVRSTAGYLADHLPAFQRDDCNEDGLSDQLQILEDPTLDCNQNQMLDACEPGGGADCNANGIPDICDIWDGTSLDGDLNGTPDECQAVIRVPSDQPTILAAIDAASESSTIILVADGVYSGSGNVGIDHFGNVSCLRSENGPQNCVVDCESADVAFNISEQITTGVVIDGFTLANGYNGSESTIVLYHVVADLVNCVFQNNVGGPYGGALNLDECRVSITNCTFEDNLSERGGAISTTDTRLQIVGCEFIRNICTRRGGSIYFAGGHLDISASIFADNAGSAGGGIGTTEGGLYVNDCVFANNTANNGGGVALYSDGIFRNCLFQFNHANALGGALYCVSTSADLADCTLSYNTATDGSQLFCYSSAIQPPSEIQISNCILWGQDDGIGQSDDSSIDISYSNVQGGWTGVGNIDADPLFADPDGPDDDPDTWEDNDYRLTAGSPCIDAGDNAAVPLDTFDLDGDGDTSEPLPLDLAGVSRFLDDAGMPDRGDAGETGLPVVDMGAYEFQGQTCFGDLDADGLIGLADLARLLGRYGRTDQAQYRDGDLDADGDVDLADLAALLGCYGDPCP